VAGREARIYLNGMLMATTTHFHDGMGMTTVTGSSPNLATGLVKGFGLCTWSFWSEVYHKGLIDEVRVWNVSRTTAQIAAGMHTKLTGSEPGLFAYWDFEGMPHFVSPGFERGSDDCCRVCICVWGIEYERPFCRRTAARQRRPLALERLGT
jgi:hypothetical protein